MIDLTPGLKKKYTPWIRKVGRYSVTDLYDIVHGNLTVKNFFKPSSFTQSSMYYMWKGKWDHMKAQDLLIELGYEIEIKKEKKINDWVVVGRADCLQLDEVIEIKTSKNILKPNPHHVFQTRIYCTLFEKKDGYIYQPMYKPLTHELYMRLVKKVQRDDAWAEEQFIKVDEFHNKLLTISNL